MAGSEPRRRRIATALGVIALAAGCSLIPFDPTPDPEAGPGLVGDCNPPLVLEKETTLGELGLAQFKDMGAAELNRRGTVRITAATVRWEDFAPPEVPAIVPEGQLLCMTWQDGSSLSALLLEPFAEPGFDLGSPAGGEAPIAALIGAAIVALLVAAASWFAFRREGRSDGA